MKKFYSLLALLLCFFAGATNAVADDVEYKWTLSEDYATQADLVDGAYIAIQAGTYAGWSYSTFLSSGSARVESTDFDETCVYQLETTGTTSDGYQLYVLKSVGKDGMYLGTEGYTLSKSDAFECTILPALFDTDNKRQTMDASAKGTKQTELSDGVAFIFCPKDAEDDGTYNYMLYIGNPEFYSYLDTNDWFVYTVTKSVKTAQDKLDELYNELFGKGWDATTVRVGSDPGCISQAVFDELLALYEEMDGVLGTEMTDEEAQTYVAKLQAAIDLYNNSFIQVEAGKYYTITSRRGGGYLYDNGSVLKGGSTKSVSSPLTVADAQYVWKVEDAGDGLFYLKNVGTGRYLADQSSYASTFPTSETSKVATEIRLYSNPYYVITTSTGHGTNYSYTNIVYYNDDNDEGNHFTLAEVPAAEVEALSEQIEKNLFLSSLSDLIDEGKLTQTKYQYNCGITMDGNYTSNAAGLVTTMTGNRTESKEGSIGGAFDGNLTTYYHTNWSSSAAFDDYDWIQVDLGKDVQNLFLKVTQRHNNRNGNPSRIALVAPADGEDLSGAWTDTLYSDTLIYQYSTPYPGGAIDNTTAVATIDLGKAVQNLRFVVLQTKANQHFGGIGPCWHVAELRFYENDGENPRYALIPDDVKQALADQIANAEAKLADSTAVQADYDALEAAIKAFEDAYPDDSRLTSLLEQANTLATTEGLEGTDLGFFEEGSQATLAAVVETVKTATADKVLTLTEIENYLTQVRTAISAFNAKLHVPEDGSLIRLKSEANSNYVYATDADTVANLKYGYQGDANIDYRLNTVWKVQKLADNSYAFRNLATGRYIQNFYTDAADPDNVSLSQALSSGDRADGFGFTSALTGGVFAISMAESAYLNTDPAGSIVNWYESTGNSAFAIESINAEELDMSTNDIETGKMQIITLPYAVQQVVPQAYKVLGQKVSETDGASYLQLATYDDSDVIPAGTPFIVNPTEEDGTLLQAFLTNAGEDFLNEEYNYGHVEQNGLVGTSNTIKIGTGLGLLVDGVVKSITSTQTVNAGAGYFKEIPETTEDGDLTVKIEGAITGINNAVVVKNVPADVYTLSGVKVRSGVKAADATNGLPAGLYIVGGKKVLVK